jgi:DNA mismatch repair ATPase MutS
VSAVQPKVESAYFVNDLKQVITPETHQASVVAKIEETKEDPDLKLDMIPIEKVDGLHSVAAVMENRAHEVGIAVFTPDLNKVTLT